jgi:hypothetical protein
MTLAMMTKADPTAYSLLSMIKHWQTYLAHSMVLRRNGVSKRYDLTGVDARIIPISIFHAYLQITNPRDLFNDDPVFAVTRKLSTPQQLIEIIYEIQAGTRDARTVYSEKFKHAFKHAVIVHHGTIKNGETQLFKRHELNDLLSCRAFPGSFGVQFIS